MLAQVCPIGPLPGVSSTRVAKVIGRARGSECNPRHSSILISCMFIFPVADCIWNLVGTKRIRSTVINLRVNVG